MTFVLDSSVSLSWCFDDEFTGATGALMERRRRIDSAKRVRHIEFLRDLPVAIDADTVSQAWTVTSQLAERHRLTL